MSNGFVDEIVGAGLECRDPLLALGRGHHDDRQELRRRVGPKPTADLIAVDVRHPDIEQDEVRELVGDRASASAPEPAETTS